MMNSNCQPPLYSSDNRSHGRCICAERKTAREGGWKKKPPTTRASAEKMVTARRRWQEALIALPQLLTINNLH